MNHQYFKEWLFTEEPLTAEQALQLEDHLMHCHNCQQLQAAWLDVDRLIKDTPDVNPLPGFTSRWEKRFTLQRKKHQNRMTWIAIIGLASIAFLVSILLSFQLFEFVRSPQPLILVFLSRVAVLLSYLTITKDYLSFFSAYLPDISLPFLVFTTGLITMLCVLWLATMKQISRVWRIVK